MVHLVTPFFPHNLPCARVDSSNQFIMPTRMPILFVVYVIMSIFLSKYEFLLRKCLFLIIEFITVTIPITIKFVTIESL